MASRLETCMATMIGVFNEFAGKEGDKFHLNQNELEKILAAEFPGYMKADKDKTKITKIMKDLDFDNDGQVSFKEFAIMLACLTIACHEHFKK
ncbi:protein S100-A1-like [Rhinoraja longicauda]